ncbi:MAG: ubiquinol-cytochrome C chaperone family protein, partial [Alphaproteobacteria bacterium]|nr:ubiquinol-cytochrome C chaperone family protein [Alphaproteobacteria bacterium]
MFSSLFRKKDKGTRESEDQARELYALALGQTRNPYFYLEMNVPDNFDGRFDFLLLNIFIILYKYYDHENYKEISQHLFDIAFKDLDLSLREMGVGDMGIPKHMRR